jgi:hypothetical protein
MPYSINDFSDKSLSDSLLLIQTLSNDIHREMKKRVEDRFVSVIPDYQDELDKSYWTGFETGITWDNKKWNWIPGGPFVLSRNSGYGITFNERSDSAQNNIILSEQKNKVWMNGWYAGNSVQLTAKK